MASDLLDLGSTEAPRWGWEHGRSHWHNRARRFPASAASTWLHRVPPHSPGTESVPISTGAALLQAIRQRKAIYYRWKHCVLKHAAQAVQPQGLGTLWLFTLCQQPAQPHQLSLCQGTDTPIFNNLPEKWNLHPASLTTHVWLLNELLAVSEEDTVTPCWETTHTLALFPRSTAALPVWKTVRVSMCPNPSLHWLSVMSCPCINPRWLQV